MNNEENGLLEVLLSGIAEEGEIDVEAWRQYYKQAEGEDKLEVIWHTAAVTLATVGKHRQDHNVLNSRLEDIDKRISRNSVGMLLSIVASSGLILYHSGVDIVTTAIGATTTGIIALFVRYITNIKGDING